MLKDNEVPYAELEGMAKSHVCACGGGLSVAYGGKFDYLGYILRCDKDPEHSDFVRPYTPTMQNTPGLPGWKLSNRRKREMATQLGAEATKALTKYEGVAALSKADARDIILTMWPKAPEVEVKKAMLICWQYKLNPLMKHIYLLKFSSKTGDEWVTALSIKTNRLLANRQGRYSYLDNTPRTMTPDEQKLILGAVDDANLWTITKIKDEHGNMAQGYGFWPKAKSVYGADKGNSIFNMSCIHSERQALDRLFPDVAPPDVEVVDERYTEEPPPLKVSIVESPDAVKPPTPSVPPLKSSEQAASAPPVVVVATSGTVNPCVTPEEIKFHDDDYVGVRDTLKLHGILHITDVSDYARKQDKGFLGFKVAQDCWAMALTMPGFKK